MSLDFAMIFGAIGTDWANATGLKFLCKGNDKDNYVGCGDPKVQYYRWGFA